jgi:hypothetical protein
MKELFDRALELIATGAYLALATLLGIGVGNLFVNIFFK